ncbi:hypothetical protein LAZ67_5003642 [Cordylochernes scorpioides]|uniref:Uncharacterized protein n=1 Tax=Cordylochernes scorpioides TaxID=51811 RepID=A0ABY6KHE2_9ARAC|nr:hypothetical protein LAZ67_5003642 [Cordylochernes scorpioides]
MVKYNVELSLVSRSEYTVTELFNMSCLSYSSILSYNRPGETPNIMTFLDWTTSPALHQINHLGITSPPLSHQYLLKRKILSIFNFQLLCGERPDNTVEDQ